MTSSPDSENDTSVRIIPSHSKSPSMKEKQVFLLFFPIVLFGLLSKSLDSLMDCSKFQTVRNYFKFVSGLRFLLFIVVITLLRTARQYISSKYAMYVLYAYNLLLSAADICVLTQFTEDYAEFSSYGYYKTLYLKMVVNYVFGICWLAMLFINLVRKLD